MTLRLTSLLQSETRYRWVLIHILDFCAQPRSFAAVQEKFITELASMTAVHSPAVLLHWLEDAGGLQRVQVDGEEMWQTVPEALAALDDFRVERQLLNLFVEKPELEPAFRQILQYSVTPRTRQEIEALLAEDKVLEQQRLHPTFLIHELESHGGLEWIHKQWRTTAAAQGVVL